jgi:hypothetical protein
VRLHNGGALVAEPRNAAVLEKRHDGGRGPLSSRDLPRSSGSDRSCRRDNVSKDTVPIRSRASCRSKRRAGYAKRPWTEMRTTMGFKPAHATTTQRACSTTLQQDNAIVQRLSNGREGPRELATATLSQPLAYNNDNGRVGGQSGCADCCW